MVKATQTSYDTEIWLYATNILTAISWNILSDFPVMFTLPAFNTISIKGERNANNLFSVLHDSDLYFIY